MNAVARAIVAALVAGGIVAFFALDAERHLSLDAVAGHRDALLHFAAAHRGMAIVVAFGVYALGVALCLPAGLVFAFACGAVFGRVFGTSLGVLAETAGATLAFVAARFLLAHWVRQRFAAAIARIDDAFADNGFWWLVFLRTVPIFPYVVVNVAPALTSVSTATFALATLVAAIPATFVYANLGATLASPDEALSPRTLGALVLVALVALVPIILHRRVRR